MGCVSSKKLLRTKSFKPNSHRPFPRVAAIPIIEDFLLANSSERFVALICKNDSITKQVPAATKQETLPSSISEDNEGKGVISGIRDMLWLDLQSGGPLREEESEKHTPPEEESEKHKAVEEGSEEDRTTEEDKTEIIYTWELMDGLEDGEADHTSEKPTDNGDGTRLIRTAKRLESMGYSHMLEEYGEVLSRRKTSHISEKPIDNGDGTRLIRTAGRSKSMGHFHTLEEYDEVLSRSKISHTPKKPTENGDGTRLIIEEESEKLTPAEEESEKHKAVEEEGSEEDRATEEDKAEIIYTWELMDGLEDGEADHTSETPTDNGDGTRLIRTPERLESIGYFHTLEEYDEVLSRRTSHISEKPIDNGDETRLKRTAGRSKSMGYFHTLEEYDEVLARSKTSHTPEKENGDGTRLIRTARRSKSMEYIHSVEEYDAVLARSKTSLWDRISKRYFYYLGHKCLDTVTKSTLNSIFSTSPLPPKQHKLRNMTPTVIDWKEDSMDDHNCALESSALQAASKQSDIRNKVRSRENNSISDMVPENTGTHEHNHLIEANEGKVYLEERSPETNQFTVKNSRKRSLHERAKVNDLGGISIPSTPDFSAVGSLREWLNGGGHLYSPGVSTTPSFGSYFHVDRRSTSNIAVNSVQFRIDEAEIEIHSPSALELDKQASITVDSGVYSDGRLTAIEKENLDSPLFDTELLASFERALEQLSEEEICFLRQLDDCSHFRDCHLEDGEDDVPDSRRVGDIPIESNCPSHQEEFSIQIPKMSENLQEFLAGNGPLFCSSLYSSAGLMDH